MFVACTDEDGDDLADGDLPVAANVHVQVSTFGGAPRAVFDPFRGDLRCYARRDTVAELTADIRSALNEVPSALVGSSLH